MLSRLIKSSLLIVALGGSLLAGNFNAQAEKDRIALEKYFVKKFKNPLDNGEFPYVDKKEIKDKYTYPLSATDMKNGTASWYKPTAEQFEEINDFPPYEIPLEDGENLFVKKFKNGKSFADCFPDVAIKQNYPYFDIKKNEVVTLGQAVNECLVKNGEKAWKKGKGKLAQVVGYIAYKSRGKKIDIKIPTKSAEAAYNAGKKMFYKQRGYLFISCAECHVQGAGKRIRAEALSPILGATTHMPVYRLKWGGLGTLQRRLAGCVKQTGSQKPKLQSRELKELEYFITYMSNGMKLNGPDTRK